MMSRELIDIFSENLQRIMKERDKTQAVLQLQGLNISETYETLTKTERRAFWRGIIKEIRVDHDGNIFYDFL